VRVVEDLGVYQKEGTATRRHYCLYECPTCLKHFVALRANVAKGTTTQCRGCAGTDKQVTAARFGQDMHRVWADTYDFSAFTYIGDPVKSIVMCKVHGEFMAAPTTLKQGKGCPQCGLEKTNIAKRTHKDGPATLYYVYFKHINMWKLGVTEKSEVESRFKPDDREHLEILMVKSYDNAGAAYKDEANILKELQEYRYNYLAYGKLLKSKGNSELFAEDVLDRVIKIL